jgi:hypothetical protein
LGAVDGAVKYTQMLWRWIVESSDDDDDDDDDDDGKLFVELSFGHPVLVLHLCFRKPTQYSSLICLNQGSRRKE